MRTVGRSIGTIALALAALFCAGCPLMMIPSLAYQGYEYEHNKNEKLLSAKAQSNHQAAAPQQRVANPPHPVALQPAAASATNHLHPSTAPAVQTRPDGVGASTPRA
jgi:hypothetical protein